MSQEEPTYPFTVRHRDAWHRFREFADRVITPRARAVDAGQELPQDLITSLAREGWLASLLPAEWGGANADPVTYGLLCEEAGRACGNVRNFVAVQDMVSYAIWKWGRPEQRERWLPGIATGGTIGAFALTEPEVGSDARGITSLAYDDGPSGLVLRGLKKWISFGQLADVFLVFARYRDGLSAFLIERSAPGVRVEPVRNLLGLRGSMLAEVGFDECRIGWDSRLGQPDSGLHFVAAAALDVGRYSTAWGSTGLAQACLETSMRYAGERTQYGKPIGEHQLVQRMLADMLAGVRASRLLCVAAAAARACRDADAVNHTLLAKYFAAATAASVAADAVQLHGAQGTGSASVVERLYRDAKVMEIIEGTSQLLQTLLGRWSGGVAHPAADADRLVTAWKDQP
jgi:hypothetical protein